MAISPLQGKDEVAGIAERGGEVLPALQRAAPGLTLQQLHKLTEHHHDDWAVGAPAAVNEPDSECHSKSVVCIAFVPLQDCGVHQGPVQHAQPGSGAWLWHVGLWPG